MKKGIRWLLFVVGVLMITGIGTYIFVQSNLEGLVGQAVGTPDFSMLEDGQYIGSYSAFPVSAEVEVTIRNHAIESIRILKHQNGQGIDGEKIIDRIVAFQSLDVDVISGATYSSQVLKLAVADALK